MLNRFKFLRDISHLVYPNSCLICEKELVDFEHEICSICEANLNTTQFHLFQEPHDMDKLFWGRERVRFSHAHLFFKKNTHTQKILFSLKYKNRPQLGRFFGRRIGKELLQNDNAKSIDLLIPVPLHPKKAFIRGYNQSQMIAEGISEHMNIPVDSASVKRIEHSDSQTGKSRFERWDNVQGSFALKKLPPSIRHIGVVDDVITTGSTVENIISLIRTQHPEIDISVITLAIA